MFAGLFTKIGVYAIIFLVLIGLGVGTYAYIESQNAKIANLETSVSSLQTSNTAESLQISHLQSDLLIVQKAQDAANKAISDATTQAKLAQQAIRSQNLNKAAQQNSVKLQTQLDTDTTATFEAWENISK